MDTKKANCINDGYNRLKCSISILFIAKHNAGVFALRTNQEARFNARRLQIS